MSIRLLLVFITDKSSAMSKKARWDENSDELYALDTTFDDLGSDDMALIVAAEAAAYREESIPVAAVVGSDDSYGFTPFGSQDLAAIEELDRVAPSAVWHDGMTYYLPHHVDNSFDTFVAKGVSLFSLVLALMS